MLPQGQVTGTIRSVIRRIEHAPSPEGIVAQAHQAVAAGFDGIEIVLPPDHGVDESMPATSSDLRSFASATHTLAVAATLLCTDVEAAAGESARLLQFAAQCRAKCLNLTLPAVWGDHRDAIRGFPGYQEALNFAHGLLHHCRYDAESTGVSIGLEVATGGCLLSPVEVRELIDAVNSPAIGACLDFDRVSLIGNPRDWLLILGRRVHCVRIGSATYPDRFPVQPAYPALDRDAIAAALNGAGYDQIVSLAGRLELPDCRAAFRVLESTT